MHAQMPLPEGMVGTVPGRVAQQQGQDGRGDEHYAARRGPAQELLEGRQDAPKQRLQGVGGAFKHVEDPAPCSEPFQPLHLCRQLQLGGVQLT